MKKVGVCWSIFFLPQNIARGKSKIKILLSFLWAAAEIFIFFFSRKTQESRGANSISWRRRWGHFQFLKKREGGSLLCLADVIYDTNFGTNQFQQELKC